MRMNLLTVLYKNGKFDVNSQDNRENLNPLLHFKLTQSAGAAEYTDSITAEG